MEGNSFHIAVHHHTNSHGALNAINLTLPSQVACRVKHQIFSLGKIAQMNKDFSSSTYSQQSETLVFRENNNVRLVDISQ